MNIHSKPPAAFYRDLAILLGEGCSLKDSISEMVSKSESSKVRRFASALSRIQFDSDREMLEACPFQFDFVAKEALLNAVDRSIAVPVLFAVAEGVETEKTLGRRVLVALAYPCAIFFFYLVLLSIVQVFVLPVFAEIFESFGSDLPGAAGWIIDSSRFIPVGMVLFVVGFVRPMREWVLRRLPLFRAIYKNADTMKVTRACLLVRKFIPDNAQALHIALRPFGMQAGVDHQQFVLNKKLSSPFVWRAISNSSNPSSELLLNDLLNSLEHRHRNLVDRAAVLSQVISMILIATLVGSLAYGVMAPIFQLSSIIH